MRISLWSSLKSSFSCAVDVKNRLNAARIPPCRPDQGARSIHYPARPPVQPGTFLGDSRAAA
jgi:hypothetical protein